MGRNETYPLTCDDESSTSSSGNNNEGLRPNSSQSQNTIYQSQNTIYQSQNTIHQSYDEKYVLKQIMHDIRIDDQQANDREVQEDAVSRETSRENTSNANNRNEDARFYVYSLRHHNSSERGGDSGSDDENADNGIGTEESRNESSANITGAQTNINQIEDYSSRNDEPLENENGVLNGSENEIMIDLERDAISVQGSESESNHRGVSLGDTDETINSIYIVPDDQIIVPTEESNPETQTQVALPGYVIEPDERNLDNHNSIPHARSFNQTWSEKPILRNMFPFLTYGRFLNFCFINAIIGLILLLISSQISKQKQPNTDGFEGENNTSSISSNNTGQDLVSRPKVCPSLSPISMVWNEEFQVDTNVAKPNKNELMGYSVSLSADGMILAVGGTKTLSIFEHVLISGRGTWIKRIDRSDFISKYNNTVDNLSENTVISLSQNGQHLVVGDEFSNLNGKNSGSIMVFTRDPSLDTYHLGTSGQSWEWRQVGPTITGDLFNKHGGRVVIAEYGTRIAASTSHYGAGYAGVYDYDGFEWVNKWMMSDLHAYGGNMKMSPNGALIALQDSFFHVVEIYELDTFTLIDTVNADLRGFGHSIAMSFDGSVVVVGSWDSSEVHVFEYDVERKRYNALTSPITIANVTGLGYSAAVSNDGKTVAISILKEPSKRTRDTYPYRDMISEGGSVALFQILEEEWKQIAEFEAENGVLFDKMGWSVSLSECGERVAIGSYGTGGIAGDGDLKRGQAYIYSSVTN